MGCQPVQHVREELAPLDPLEEAVQPMEVEAAPIEAVELSPVLKKKKKKTSYRAMMASVTQSGSPRDVEKERESIRKATGGGAFSKIDKI